MHVERLSTYPPARGHLLPEIIEMQRCIVHTISGNQQPLAGYQTWPSLMIIRCFFFFFFFFLIHAKCKMKHYEIFIHKTKANEWNRWAYESWGWYLVLISKVTFHPLPKNTQVFLFWKISKTQHFEKLEPEVINKIKEPPNTCM
jgi:hypothetical protein